MENVKKMILAKRKVKYGPVYGTRDWLQIKLAYKVARKEVANNS